MNTTQQVDAKANKVTTSKAKAKAPVATTAAPGIEWFDGPLSTWQVATMGAKPTAAMFKAALVLGGPKGKRPGVEALQVAMCLRREGCTVRQFCTAGSCGPANNWRRSLWRDHKVVTEGKQGNPYAFTLRLTAKGRDMLKAAGVPTGELQMDPALRVAKPAKATSEAAKPVTAPAIPAPADQPAKVDA